MTDGHIRHVVVLMMENHSFDELLGCMKKLNAGIAGVDETNLRPNKKFPDTATAVTQNANSTMAIS